MRIIFCLLLLFLGSSCSSSHQKDVSQLLEKLAEAESKEEISKLKISPKKLNGFMESILQKDDLAEIELLRRALENYNAFSDEKTNPFVQYYRHYYPPAFAIPKIDLMLDVKKDHVVVTEKIKVTKIRDQKFLALDGVGHKVLSVSLDGKILDRKEYRVTPNELIILKLPQSKSFELEIQSKIDPFNNLSLEGLYATHGLLITQCESEGARKIFYTLDRPDVLSQITTTIIADKKKYPYRLSNGNLIDEKQIDKNRYSITWEDPIAKPSYLFACVLGDFDRLEDSFTTRSGKKVSLEVYVGKGKQNLGEYSLFSLKKAMEFDERFFDREYDLDSLKMVAAPDFNSGAMENKGLLIFNELALLVDKDSGTDASFRRVATVVAHEYFHNWSGNRVTVRNWFELALKEGFTDFRATLFAEWLYGFSFIRPKDVIALRERQFPEELSENGHPIMVESYVNARSIYDSTTYVKGREVFRTLQTYLDGAVKDGFRKAQNLYYQRYDGQAVTFKELLSAANEILKENNQGNLDQFERWFTQQGTPIVSVEAVDGNLKVTQICIDPRTKKEQDPLLIPFSYELLREDGSVYRKKETAVLSERVHFFEMPANQKLIPVFMHGYSAPVILKYPYTMEELSQLLLFATDPYIQWESGQSYSLLAVKEFAESFDEKWLQPYKKALKSNTLSPLAKAHLLQLPSVRALSQHYRIYDFRKLGQMRELFSKALALVCKDELREIISQNKPFAKYEPSAEQMQIRELRKISLHLLGYIDSLQSVQKAYFKSDNFDTTLAMFAILSDRGSPLKEKVSKDFYNRYKNDKMILNYWFSVQSSASVCRVSDLKQLQASDGYDGKNPNHIRSVLSAFISNLPCYHDPKGEGYAFIVDQIIEIAKFNPMIAHNNLASIAFIDYEHLSSSQKELMKKELIRLQKARIPEETREMLRKLLADT